MVRPPSCSPLLASISSQVTVLEAFLLPLSQSAPYPGRRTRVPTNHQFFGPTADQLTRVGHIDQPAQASCNSMRRSPHVTPTEARKHSLRSACSGQQPRPSPEALGRATQIVQVSTREGANNEIGADVAPEGGRVRTYASTLQSSSDAASCSVKT